MPPLQAAFLWVPSLLGTPTAFPFAASPNGADQGRHLPDARRSRKEMPQLISW
jgi:hypothetical protein